MVLVRMSRFFNTENSTVFFDGKFAGVEVFKSLGKEFCTRKGSSETIAAVNTKVWWFTSALWFVVLQRAVI